jgi:hypothetical protein
MPHLIDGPRGPLADIFRLCFVAAAVLLVGPATGGVATLACLALVTVFYVRSPRFAEDGDGVTRACLALPLLYFGSFTMFFEGKLVRMPHDRAVSVASSATAALALAFALVLRALAQRSAVKIYTALRGIQWARRHKLIAHGRVRARDGGARVRIAPRASGSPRALRRSSGPPPARKNGRLVLCVGLPFGLAASSARHNGCGGVAATAVGVVVLWAHVHRLTTLLLAPIPVVGLLLASGALADGGASPRAHTAALALASALWGVHLGALAFAIRARGGRGSDDGDAKRAAATIDRAPAECNFVVVPERSQRETALKGDQGGRDSGDGAGGAVDYNDNDYAAACVAALVYAKKDSAMAGVLAAAVKADNAKKHWRHQQLLPPLGQKFSDDASDQQRLDSAGAIAEGIQSASAHEDAAASPAVDEAATAGVLAQRPHASTTTDPADDADARVVAAIEEWCAPVERDRAAACALAAALWLLVAFAFPLSTRAYTTVTHRC